VVGEIALGHLRRRDEILSLLTALPALTPVNDADVLEFIGQHHLPGTGIGWVDAHLLAAVDEQGAGLLTSDKALAAAAARLGLLVAP
jgi:hypothetical protein